MDYLVSLSPLSFPPTAFISNGIYEKPISTLNGRTIDLTLHRRRYMLDTAMQVLNIQVLTALWWQWSQGVDEHWSIPNGSAEMQRRGVV